MLAAALLAPAAIAQNPDDGFDPNVNNSVSAVAAQADGKIVIGGAFTTIGVTTTRHRIARLDADGSVEASFNPDADSSVSAIALQGNGGILIAGGFTMLNGGAISRNHLARLNPDGSVDLGFDAGANGSIGAIAVQDDGRILIGGSFTTLKGGTVPRNRIARLNADGSVDMSFDPGVDNGGVIAIAVQADGRILIGGSFTTLAGGSKTRHYIARLEKTGQVDDTFNPDADNFVYAIGVQSDASVVFGGAFTHLANGTIMRNRIARVDAAGSIDASFNPNADNNVLQVVVQGDDRVLLAGNFTSLNGGLDSRNHIARLLVGGEVDTSFDPNAGGNVFALATQPDEKILVGGIFTSLNGGAVMRNHLARLYADGGVDRTLNPDANGFVYALAPQLDGKVVIGGLFTTFDAGSTMRNHIARLNPDGSLDAFDPNIDGTVFALAVQPNRTILAGGNFTSVNAGNLTRHYVARLKENGTGDSTFNPDPDSLVLAFGLQPDGDILIGGNFLALKGGTSAHPFIARLASDGSVDESFNPDPDSLVLTIAVQPDGKILIGGLFSTLNGHAIGRSALARLNPDGSVDQAFDPQPDSIVDAIALQPDGSILVGGAFTSFSAGKIVRNRIARLDANGSVDMTFNPDADGTVMTLATDTEGRILVGGGFTHLNGGKVIRHYLARLDGAGNVDDTFDPDPGATVDAVAIARDGKVLLGGEFTTLEGGAAERHHVARLSTPEAALQSLFLGPGEVTWYRFGAGPELLAAPVVGFSHDGYSFDSSGTLHQIMGGWSISGLAFPAGTPEFVRVIGLTGSGLQNGSSGVVASVRRFYISDDIFANGFE